MTRLNYTDLSIIILDLFPQSQDQVPPMCISSCVNVCFHAGLPRSLYIQCDCVFPCWTPTELVYLLVLMLDPTELLFTSVNVCFHAGLPRSLYIQCECVFTCWT